ncbi:DUF2510 domain-containing protein [Glaciihabitans sp. INWT7]|uniref:DUF2510 domain-containing protein n=1 Tax=Glaciihabitans sp. INWT7 TaxID=2596912 RepID=UPI00162ABBE5|nr:DUF2510 domain-containing protein [Glaciihabitans sp. INWT7]QNE46738.1 DUF2510 domain-containing protein [Glaciihabitans sp. INWT7]
MSLTLQSDTEAQPAAPSRRSALHGVGPVPAEPGEGTVAAATSAIAAGWYADPMGAPLSRWWDGTAWTAELSAEAPAEPGTEVRATVESPAAEVNSVPAAADPVAALPPVAPATPSALPADAPAVPLSRRQLRELVGPLTTGPVPTDTTQAGPVAVEVTDVAVAGLLVAPEAAPLTSAAFAAGAATESAAPSPFEALFSSSPAERESAESAAFDATAFLGTAPVSDSSVARPWIGAAAPLVPAASVPEAVTVQPSPTIRAEAPAAVVAESATPSFSAGPLGFILPPDPFATPAASGGADPLVTAPTFAPPVAPAIVPTVAKPTRSNTAAIWLFVLLPILHVALVWFVLVWLDLGGDPLVRYSVLGAPLFLYLVFAFADRRVLRSRGFERPASVVLALIPPVYLLVRAIRVGAAGVVPLLLWLLLQTAAYSFVLLQFPAVFALAPLTPAADSAPVAVVSGPITDAQRAAELTPKGMAAELTRQTLAKNLTFSSISCPAIAVNLDGTAVTCIGTLDSVKMNLNVVIDSTLPNSAFALVSEAPAS